MFYGWGKSSQEWSLGDGNTLVCAYNYVALMFIFRLAFKQKYHLIGDSRSQDVQVSRSELEQRYGTDVPKLSLWTQFGLLIGVAALVLVMVVVGLFS